MSDLVERLRERASEANRTSDENAELLEEAASSISGATARIDAIEKERNEVLSKYGLETMGGIGYDVLDRHLNGNWGVTHAAQNKTIELLRERIEELEKAMQHVLETRLISTANLVAKAALSQAQQSEPS